MKQKTLKGSFSLFGKGLHTGLNLTVTFNPAPENHGYKIQRIDMEGEPTIDAIAENVIDTQRGTVLGKGEMRVSTVEHGLSALYALYLVTSVLWGRVERYCQVQTCVQSLAKEGETAFERFLFHSILF